MSKPPSGLFLGTKGELAFYGDAESLIAARVLGLDLREHPLTRKQLSSKQRKEIKKRIEARTATHEEYKHYLWDQRLRNRRKAGVDMFWAEEALRIASGQKGTRNWTAEQREDILAGHKPKFKGRTLESHHTFSVLKYPHLANVGGVIYPATHLEHKKGWHGGSYRKSKPGKRYNRLNEF